MRVRIQQFILITASSIAMWVLAFPQAEAQNSAQPVHVLWSDIGNKVQIIGRLGKPMNTMMGLRGEWRKPEEYAKPRNTDALDFYVSHVDGTKLSSPIRFLEYCVEVSPGLRQDALLKPAAGEIWECRACEVGSFPNAASMHWEDFYGTPVSAIGYDGEFAPELLIAQRTVRKNPAVGK